MFTGIVEELGAVVALDWPAPDAARLRIRGPLVTSDARPGDSIAVNGVCLTVVEQADGVFSADVMAETLQRSALRGLAVGDPVNLERAVTAATRLGGHIVQGHVDGVGQVLQRLVSVDHVEARVREGQMVDVTDFEPDVAKPALFGVLPRGRKHPGGRVHSDDHAVGYPSREVRGDGPRPAADVQDPGRGS